MLAILLSGCIVPVPRLGPKPEEAQRDENGRPIFVGNQFRHRAGTPFWCHTFIDKRQGFEYSSCHEIQQWCVRDLRDFANHGFPVGECAPKEQVTCVTSYTRDPYGNNETKCFQAKKHCANFVEREVGQGRPEMDFTACTVLDTSFQPKT